MNIIVLTHKNGRAVRRSFHSVQQFLVLGLGVLALGGLIGMAGYSVGKWSQAAGVATSWQLHMAEQQQAVAEVRRNAQAEVNALTARLAELQSRVTRLDALGRKLIDVSHIDAEEFDFDSVPGVGGPAPDDGSQARGYGMGELSDAIAAFEHTIDDRERQLAVLEGVLTDRRLDAATTPAGRPIVKGWLSSPYGHRDDPFTGKRTWHAGIDFAGRAGSPVVAVAGGVVTYAGDRWGYGNLVEITHGNGYVTRYGHNENIVVSEGEIVRRGDQIAEMGSSGRSTGPHVHLEVLKDGRAINPWKFVQAER